MSTTPNLSNINTKYTFFFQLIDVGSKLNTITGEAFRTVIPKYVAVATLFNPLALELDMYSLTHHLCKMRIFYEPRRVTLGNTRHFVEE